MEFKTSLEDCNLYGLSKHLGMPQVDIDTSKTCSVNWAVNIEARSWGIKSIESYAVGVIVSIDWSVYLDELTQDEKDKLIDFGGKEYSNTIEGTIEIDSTEKWNGKEWTIKNEIALSEYGAFYPQSCEIDFQSMEILIL